MKNKIITMLLVLSLIFTFPLFSFALDEDVDTNEEPKIEAPTEEVEVEPTKEQETEPPKEEVKQEKPKQEETKEEPKETTPPTEPKKEVKKIQSVKKSVEKNGEETQYPFTVKFSFSYRKGSQVITDPVSPWKNEINESNKNKVFTNSVKIKACDKHVRDNRADSFSYDGYDWEYTGDWVGVINGEKITYNYNKEDQRILKMNASDFTEDTTIVFEAQYTKTKKSKVTIDYIDQIARGSHTWKTGENTWFDGYSAILDPDTKGIKEPADIPTYEKDVYRYEFKYWDCTWNGTHYAVGDDFTVKKTDVTEDVEIINLYATYKPIIRINYHDENGKLLGSVTDKTINIYESGEVYKDQGDFLGWYEDGELIPSDTVRELPLTRVDVTTEFDVYAKYKQAPSPAPGSDPKPDPTPDPEPTPDPPQKPDPTPSHTHKATPTKQTQPVATDPLLNPNGLFLLSKNTEEETEPAITIRRGLTPLGAPYPNYWALLNLLLAIATCILAVILLIFGIFNEQQEDEEVEIKNKWWARIASICVGIIALLVFLLTEDMTNPWTWTDRWTLLMAIIFVVNIILMFLAKHKEIREEEEIE